jgi:membrane-associated phospholipid phosphatase
MLAVKRIRYSVSILLILAFLIPLLVNHDNTASGQEGGYSVPTAEHSAQIAHDWMFLLYQLVRDESINAPAASRFYAYAGVALYEAVVPGMPDNFSIVGSVQGNLRLLPYPEEGLIYDFPSVANASLATVLTGLFEQAEAAPETLERIAAMRQQQTDSRLQDVPADVVENSLALGDEIGVTLLEWILEDNYGPTRKWEYQLPVGELHLWVPTAEGMQPLEPFWGYVRPFGMGYPEQCHVDMDMPFSSEPESTFYKQANEVFAVGNTLTDEQREIARFWVDTPGITGAPSGHWVLIEMQVAQQLNLSLARAAEMYILVDMALADAFISAWNLKYQDNLLRPVTYIRQYIRRNWSPYIETPPFPEYPSGHSVASGAAAEVLTTMFGQVAFVDRTPILNGHEQIQRSFTSFEAAATEAAISRLYGGIHYRAAIENGLRQGRCVGQTILNNVRLRSVPQGE